MEPGYVVVIMVICGLIASGIASSKNRSGLGWFFVGALLNLIGIIIVAVLPNGEPAVPSGMRKMYCKRCNAVQNVPLEDSSFECWQCKKTNQLG